MRTTTALALCCALLASTPAPAQPTVAQTDLQRLAAWLAGEWNNNEQVWQQKIDINDPKVTAKPALSLHGHQLHALVAPSALGALVMYTQRGPGADPLVATARELSRFSADTAGAALRQEVFVPRDAALLAGAPRDTSALAAISPQDVGGVPACVITWRFNGAEQAFDGDAPAATCAGAPGRAGTYRLTADGLTAPPGTRSRKVRYFEGWVWIKHAGPAAAADDKNTSFMRRVQLHSEGQRLTVKYNDGSDSPYDLELALLTYQNTKKPILKFALIDRASGKSVAYTWANTEAALIGMNLGWFQSGMTQKAERVNFGY